MIRRRPHRWFALSVLASTVALLAVAASLQPARLVRLEVSYRGTPPFVPRSFTLHQTWVPGRSIPFWTGIPHWNPLDGGWSLEKDEYESERTLAASPTGLSAVLDVHRRFSPGGYWMVHGDVESPSPDVSAPRSLEGVDLSGSRRAAERDPTVSGEVARFQYHFLDVATGSASFSIPLPSEVDPSSSLVSVDFDPIVYTSFVDPPGHPRWAKTNLRCWNRGGVFLSPGRPSVLRYEVTRFPGAPPVPPPSGVKVTEAFIVDSRRLGWSGSLGTNERRTPADWSRLRALAEQLGELGVKLDRGAATVTLEFRSPPDDGGVLHRGDALLIIGTPSADGRFFGTDCVRLGIAR